MEKWKNGLTSIIFLVMWFQCVVARDPTPKAYIKTSGKREKGLGIQRIPERIEVATCLARCQQTPACVCVRIATTGSGICETFTNMSNPNILKTTGFAYYAADMYKKTLETHSLALAKPSYQSSTYRLKNVKYTADRANDGNRNVEGFLQPYFAHTMDGPDSEPYPWWQVDLEDEYVITGIFILNRRNWDPSRKRSEALSKWDTKCLKKSSLCGEHGGGYPEMQWSRKFVSPLAPLYRENIAADRHPSAMIVRKTMPMFC
ncbi:FTP domain-containing protein [Nephila pilipes]|uniref:FTP domain-containing protein n=1 Tax=Nephila pilipes TaxID=299642 RepID=A0A8X6I3A4_NEPPI|nr:FTP domain-containing protein [Nephila pilipes]